jgi:hypothetical protein
MSYAPSDTTIRISRSQAERLISQRLRDENAVSPGRANAVAESIVNARQVPRPRPRNPKWPVGI